MAPVKMIAIDLDDTLLHDDISLSDYTKDILRKVMERNIRIVIATGRMFQAARPWGQAIGLGDVPLICYTGAFVGLCESGRVLRDVTMDMEMAQGIIDTAHERGWYMHAYIDDEVTCLSAMSVRRVMKSSAAFPPMFWERISGRLPKNRRSS